MSDSISFGQPLFLFGLALVPLMVLFLTWARARRLAAIQKLGDPALIRRLSENVNRPGRLLRHWLWILALTLLVVALARPQWGSEAQQVEQQGVQVMVALDVSNSMLAEDIRPNRLTRAKQEISDLMNRLDGDEVGLVLFSGASYIQFPLTSDYSTARSFLDAANTNSISRQGTKIADAIRTAMQGFDPNLASQKVIVIVTDGENHEDDPVAAAQDAAAQGVIVYALGFGSPEGAPIPEYNEFGQNVGYKTDQSGNTVITRLDEATLQQVAQVGGGQYFRASGGSEIGLLIDAINTLQAGSIESRAAVIKIERYQPFLLAALVAAFLAELIPDRVARRGRVRMPRLGRRAPETRIGMRRV